MKIEAKLFEVVTVFFVLVAIVYGTFTGLSDKGIEWAGLTAIVLSAGLTLIVGTYFRFVARRLDTRPEDYEDAEISDGAGDLGFFSAGSYWPILLAGAAAFAAIALAFYQPWMIVLAVALILAAAAGLVFEYHIGPEKH
ncbi:MULTISPECIES: cytochrome c oxidase subunit 4 [Rhodococcus]|uniref:Cytochrome c oxidase polypeptide 4 n=1 Tax=Rhodococcus rhodochrous J45 TaxID=935266 RepID=A0A562END3_RHORH|nr:MULTISPECIES: cytochrome c oxidase subunit 4 [Rhodococcus]MCD2096141.1 cytochrome c oxidase subunit 4 [Rhodococcus rhodochrous]MCD2120899.1 cytochrome c oxidase subunit 4 [Rhodococcus rhodochrous]MCQ4134517.1 cytochrome c oxidase subunit 4 [Rhodococcus rhodochrous]MDJ0017765.1 cytochrome c oxidase subunit 4 [Rhodococcus rhodochrous]MXQ76812.1 cytochrome c oxidase subunit 4 [Rhodococcus rhodochrous]